MDSALALTAAQQVPSACHATECSPPLAPIHDLQRHGQIDLITLPQAGTKTTTIIPIA